MDATYRLREEFKPFGSRVIYVWHQPEGIEGLKRLALERDYIAIGIPELRFLASGGKKVLGSPKKVRAMCADLLRRVHTTCREVGKLPPRIHLLGCTVADMLETREAYSCDSTSWLSGIRYGQGYMWTGSGLETVHLRSPKYLEWKRKCREANPEAVEYASKSGRNLDYMLNCLAAAVAFAQYQQWLDSRYNCVPMRGVSGNEGKAEEETRGSRAEEPASRSVQGGQRRRRRAEPLEPKPSI